MAASISAGAMDAGAGERAGTGGSRKALVMDIQMQALYTHHRMTGKAIGTGKMQVKGEEWQAVILATDEHTRTAHPVENVLPASLNDVANDLFAEVTRAIETAAFLGLDRTMIERVLHEALAEVQVPDAPSDR